MLICRIVLMVAIILVHISFSNSLWVLAWQLVVLYC